MAKRDYFMRTPSGKVFSTSFPEYSKECEQLNRAEGEKIYRAQVLADIKKKVKPQLPVAAPVGQLIRTERKPEPAGGLKSNNTFYPVFFRVVIGKKSCRGAETKLVRYILLCGAFNLHR